MTDDEYATWDAPYVLGALERAERLEYEQHLTACPHCRAAVAELAGIPGLLGRVEPEVALALVEPIARQPLPARLTVPDIIGDRTADTDGQHGRPDPRADEPAAPPADLLPRLAERARGQRRRARWATVGAAVATAAAAVAIAIPITATVAQRDAPPATSQVVAQRQLEPVVATPVSASVKVLDADGRATVEMSCRYPAGERSYRTEFELWLTSRTGTAAKLMGWSAGPGEALTMTRTTDLPPDQIASLEVRTGGATVLRSAI